jgi:hypothetical protein
MRVPAAILTVLCAILCQQAQADDPPAPGQAAAPATVAALPGAEQKAAPQAASSTLKPEVTVVGSKPELTADEKELINRGYKLEMHDGEKFFCRREEQLGSRVNTHKTCDTGQSIQAHRADSREAVRAIQTNTPHINN